MNIPVLNVEPRTDKGKGPAKLLRTKGRIPGVCYGRQKDPLSLTLDPEELLEILRGPHGLNALIKLEGAEGRTVFVQDLQRDPVERVIIHVDFVHVDTDKRIRRNVQVEFTGKSEGVKLGGVLQITRREILVESLPTQIPEKVIINVEPLLIGHSVHVEEIDLPEGVQAIYERNYSICAVVAPTEDKAEDEAAAEAGAEDGEPVEGEQAADGKPGEDAAGDKKEEKPAGDKK